MGTPPDQTTRLLNRMSGGDAEAADELLRLIYGELRALAGAHMRSEAASHTLQPTALVHEAFLRLVDVENASWESRKQFFSMASRVMRSLLVDHARRKNAKKRGGDRVQVALEEGAVRDGANELDVLEMHEALESLAKIDAELVELVELRYFSGLTVEETSRALGVPLRTVERRLATASAWLRERLD